MRQTRPVRRPPLRPTVRAPLRTGQPNDIVDTGLRGGRFWAVLVATGIGAGLGGAALTLLLRVVQHAAFGATEESFLRGVEQSGPGRRVLVLALAGLLVGLGGWALQRWGHPSRGVSDALWLQEGPMGLRSTVAGGVLQIVTVAMGSSLGREAAPKELGAALGQTFGRRVGLDAGQVRLLLASGAGAGMAAVYNVPLGGALFAAEVLLGTLALRTVAPLLLSALLATVVAWVVIPQEPVYRIPAYGTSASLLVWSVLFGPVAGLVAVALVRGVGWAKRHRPTGRALPLTAVPVLTALGGLAILRPEVLGNGKGPTQVAFDGTGSLALLAALVVLKPLATLACLRAGATGGLFTPVLSTGAVLGGATALLWTHVWPGAPVGAFAVVGAAAVLAAATQGPVSSIVLVLELTGIDVALLVPVLAACTGAVLTARALEDRSVYTATYARAPAPGTTPG